MTRRVTAGGPGFPRAWLVPLLIVAGVVGTALFGLLSRSVLLDLVAWWPVWLGLVLLALIGWIRRRRQAGAGGPVPLLATFILILFINAHLYGWDAMPSAASRLTGPEVDGITAAALSARIDGELSIAVADHGFLYSVEPLRRGGDVALPAAMEREEGVALAVVLEPVTDAGLYTFSGWELALHPGPVWTLTLSGMLDGDFRGVAVAGVQLEGSGELTMGRADTPTPVTVSGTYTLTVPAGVAVTVVGEAQVPGGWTRTDSGYQSPTAGEGWVISIAPGAAVRIVEL